MPTTYAPHAAQVPDRRTGARRYAHGDAPVRGVLRGAIAKALVCPLGHRLHGGNLLKGSTTLQCEHRERAGGPECGLLVYVLHDVFMRVTYVAEVRWDEVQAIAPMTDAHEILAFLGFPIYTPPQRRRGQLLRG